jgi:hypothetical protein
VSIVSTERDRKRVSAAKKPDAADTPSTSPRWSQTTKVDPSRSVSRTGSEIAVVGSGIDRLATAEIEEVEVAEVDRELDRVIGPNARRRIEPGDDGSA